MTFGAHALPRNDNRSKEMAKKTQKNNDLSEHDTLASAH